VTVYYIDPAAANDLGSGGVLSPFKTFAHALSHMNQNGGDTLYLRGGTYTGEQLNIKYWPNTGGTTIAGYPDDGALSAVIDGTGVTFPTYERGLIFIGHTPNMTVRNIYVTMANGRGIEFEYSNNLTVEDCKSRTSRDSGIYIAACNNGEVSGNTIQQALWDPIWGTSGGGNEVLSVAGEDESNPTTYMNIHHNILEEGYDSTRGGEGLNLKQNVRYCYVHDNIVRLNTSKLGFGLDGNKYGASDIYFYNNISYANRYGIIIETEWGYNPTTADGGPWDWPVYNVWVWNNLCYYIGRVTNRDGQVVPGAGLAIPGTSWGSYPGKLHDIYFWNNTCHDCAYGIHNFSQELTSPIHYRNNILYQCDTTIYDQYDAAQITHSNYVTANPYFRDATGRDYHLTAASTNCIGQGMVVSGPSGYTPNVSVDYDGVTRGVAFDIGAYEYAAGETPPTGPITLSVR
jgi:parallel beta-helix repeat protein